MNSTDDLLFLIVMMEEKVKSRCVLSVLNPLYPALFIVESHKELIMEQVLRCGLIIRAKLELSYFG